MGQNSLKTLEAYRQIKFIFDVAINVGTLGIEKLQAFNISIAGANQLMRK